MRWYDYQMLVLAQQPFSLWDIPRMGVKRAKLRLVLLASKLLEVGTASAVRVFERNGLGMLVFTYPDSTRVTITSLATGVFQNIRVDPAHASVDEVVSALAESYVFKTEDCSEPALKRQIEQVGLKLYQPEPVTNPRPASAPAKNERTF